MTPPQPFDDLPQGGTHGAQAPIPVGESFRYELELPDPGVYWYHPHIREDYGQELGLYGNILVRPREPDYWPPWTGSSCSPRRRPDRGREDRLLRARDHARGDGTSGRTTWSRSTA